MPVFGSVNMPKAWPWDTAQSIVSGLIIAIVAFLLARRRFKSDRWHERRAEAYGKLVGFLHVIERNTSRLREIEDHAGEPDFIPAFSTENLQSFKEKRRAAHDHLSETFEEHRYLLSASAARILDRYFQQMDELRNADTHYPEAWWDGFARPAYRDLRERQQVDIGLELGLALRVRRMGRAIMATWRWTKRSIGNTKHRVLWWWEDWQLLRGPQLTQSDVRTPPRYNHFKTVEEMKRLGLSKAAIQRNLRMQLAADPPPWGTVPPGT